MSSKTKRWWFVAAFALMALLAAGVCFGPQLVQQWRGPESAAVSLESIAAEPGQADPFVIVPEKYRQAVRRSFAETPSAKTLNEDLTVYRFWGGGAAETGSPWYTTTEYTDRADARRFLALPESNTAENETAFTIPRGTTVLEGKIASMVGVEGFGAGAVGGGTQIYLPDPSKAVKIGARP